MGLAKLPLKCPRCCRAVGEGDESAVRGLPNVTSLLDSSQGQEKGGGTVGDL